MVSRVMVCLGFAALAAGVPARGDDWLGVLSDVIDAASDGGYEYEYDYVEPIRPQQQQWVQPTQRIWNGSYWETVPVGGYQGGVVSSAPTVVTPAAPYTGPGVTIVLEEQVGGEVTYLVDGRETATIRAGQQQTLPNKGKYEVRFSRGRDADGRDYGEARYTITEGSYHFTVTDKGWELFRDPGQPNVVSTDVSPSRSITPQAVTQTTVIPVQPQFVPQRVPQFVPQQNRPPAVDPFMNQGTMNSYWNRGESAGQGAKPPPRKGRR